MLTQRYSNSAEYGLEGINLKAFIDALVLTDHFLVYTKSKAYEEQGIYFVASGNLADKAEVLRRMLQRANHARLDGIEQMGSSTRSMSHLLSEEFAEVLTEEEENVGYLLILSPVEEFLWHGTVLLLDMPLVDLDFKEQRVRLVADGGHDRLVKARQMFTDLCVV